MQFLANLRNKYLKLMTGRYGFDRLNGDILVAWLVLSFLNNFIRSRSLTLVGLLLILFTLLRMFSTNTAKRSRENQSYVKLRKKLVAFCKLHVRIIKESKTHKYYRCKNCSSYIRVKRKKGEHYVVCPKCGKEFKVKIRFAATTN